MGMDVSGLEPVREEGKYFQANVWSWRPICDFMEAAGFAVPENWHYNDGGGLRSAPECDALSKQLQEFLRNQEFSVFVRESDCRVNPTTGEFMGRGTVGGESAYKVYREHIEDWIRFLRACGGFEIW